MQILIQLAEGDVGEHNMSMPRSPSSEVVAIFRESAERLNTFSNQIDLRCERDDAYRIAQVCMPVCVADEASLLSHIQMRSSI